MCYDYPTEMEANGRIYHINTDYRIALACYKAINDSEITNVERFYAVESLLLGTEVLAEDENILKSKIAYYLRCGKTENINLEEIDMDYFQDERLIRISIKQAYNNLDISKLEYLHWWEFNDLIAGLTQDSILDRIRQLRSYDISSITNLKELEKIKKAKENVSLKKERNRFKLTKKQIESAKKFYELTAIKR